MPQSSLSFRVNWVSGPTPNFSGLHVSAKDILQGLLYQPGASVITTGTGGREYFYTFPTLFYRDPQLPGLEYIKNSAGAYELSRILNDVSMGSGRDSAKLDNTAAGHERFVIVDHGSEYAEGQHTWPFGHVWVATDRGHGYEFQQISSVRAFYHAVDTADLNGDGLADIVAMHMGVKPGAPEQSLHAYLQQKDGSFVQDKNFAASILSTWGSGASALGDVNGDGVPEIIQANYITHPHPPAWGSLRILSRDSSGEYRVTYELPEHGLFASMGASRIVPFDYNQDGHLDLVVSLEGGEQGPYANGLGFEIYKNNGHGQFARVTPELMDVHAWGPEPLGFREFEVVDFDADGFPDIVLNGWQGDQIRGEVGLSWNLSAQMFRNVGGQKFIQLSSMETHGLDLPEFGTYENMGKIVEYGRVNTYQTEGLEVVLMQRDGTPITVKVDPVYRDASEQLAVGGVGTKVKGYGGNDQFTITGSAVEVDGGSGIDTAIYHSSITDFSITGSGSTVFVSRGNATDTLRNVEVFQFQDGELSAPEMVSLNNPDAIFRFYNEASGTHFYTSSPIEAGGLVRQSAEFQYEGIAFNQASQSAETSTEIFRFYNHDTGSHFYTANAAEKDFVIENYHQFLYEGVAYYAHSSQTEGSTGLYRFFNNNTGSHFYTANKEEMEHVQLNLSSVYSYEGIAYYVEVA